MSGFVGILSPHLQDTDKSLLDTCSGIIASCCNDYLGGWSSRQADFRFGWLKTVDDTITEELPFSVDGNLRIVGDVRLDNRTTLIQRLQTCFKGIAISTPDVYLVLYAYKQWGEECLQFISGDFSFAIWNEAESCLFCARDHFGLIPFYYSLQGHQLFFTNFFQAIKALPHLMDNLDDDVLKDYLTIGVNTSIDQTIYKQIKKLPPAHQLIYRHGQVIISRYWEIPKEIKPIRYKSNTAYAAHFYRLFEQSVRDRLRNRKVACSLSGGMDSSAIAATAKNVLTAAHGNDGELIASNIVYNYLVSEQEGYFADLTANHLRIPVRKYIAEDYLKNIVQPLSSWIPEPAAIPNATAENAILSDVEQFTSIYLTGFGGDPLFEYENITRRRLNAQGYLLQPLRDDVHMYKTLGLYSNPLLNRMKKWLMPSPKNEIDNQQWYDPQFFSGSIQNETNRDGSSIRSIYAMSVNSYWAHLFESFHPGFTYRKVKVRQPFFSLDLYMFMLALPPHLLYQKSLLRMAMTPYLPEAVVKRPKTPLFGSPHRQNLESEEIHAAMLKGVKEGTTFLKGKVDTTLLLEELNNPQQSFKSQKALLNILTVISWKNAC